jgi:hypothetical protein
MNIPPFFHNYLQNDNMKEYNVKSRMGTTGYIDYITEEDFTLAKTNIIYGYDQANRFFVSIMYKNLSVIEEEQPRIMTIFQRYTNENYFFVSCGDIFKHNDIQTGNFEMGKIPESFLYFFELIEKGNVSITSTIYDYTKKTEMQITHLYELIYL